MATERSRAQGDGAAPTPGHAARDGARSSTMSETEFRTELWRALIIVVRACMKRWGMKPPTL